MVGDATKAKVACHDMFQLMDRISAIDGLEPTGVKRLGRLSSET